MAAPVPPTGGRAPATWQTYVRNLDWFVTQANLKEEACNSGGVAQDDIVEVRLCRTGHYFPGKLCSAFLFFGEQGHAEQVAQSWNAKAIAGLSRPNTALICKAEVVEKKGAARQQIFAQAPTEVKAGSQPPLPPPPPREQQQGGELDAEGGQAEEEARAAATAQAAAAGAAAAAAANALFPAPPHLRIMGTTSLPPRPSQLARRPVLLSPRPGLGLHHPAAGLPPPPPPPPPPTATTMPAREEVDDAVQKEEEEEEEKKDEEDQQQVERLQILQALGEAVEEEGGEGIIDGEDNDEQEKQEHGEESKPELLNDGSDDGYGLVDGGGDFLETKTTTPTSPGGGGIQPVESGEETLPDLPEEEPELEKMEATSPAESEKEAAEMKPWERRQKRKEDEEKRKRIAATGSGSLIQPKEETPEKESSKESEAENEAEEEEEEDDDEEKPASEFGKKESWSGVDMGN